MLKFFRKAFGLSGDRTAVPDDADPSGNVSYAQGYGLDYQRGKLDPAAKNIERDKMNAILFDVTNAIAELQGQGVPDFITSALNGGAAFSYGQNAVVRYSGDLYVSLVAANTALPSDATKWALLPIPSRLQNALNTRATAAGTVDALTATFTPALTAYPAAPGTISVMVRAAGANTATAPTFAPDGLAAKPIVKGANAALLAGDIAGAGHWLHLDYDPTLGKWVLQNPATGIASASASAPIQGSFKNLATSATGLSADVSVTVDEIAVESAANTYRTLRNVSLTIAGTSVGANGIDAGTIDASTWYSLWVIWNGTTTAGLMSLSATGPTLPSGYTHKARVGWIRTDGTANKYPLSFIQYGRKVRYKVASASNVVNLPILASGVSGSPTTPTWTAVAWGTAAPPTVAALQVLLGSNSSSPGVVLAAPNASYGAFTSNSNPAPLVVQSSTGSGVNEIGELIPESANIYYASNAPATYLGIYGWEDNL